MNARERLRTARLAAEEGRFAEALNEYIWFHDHVLDDEPSMRGVRLSFALIFWHELGGQYPPARAALQRVRNEKTRILEQGSQDWELFDDVIAINQELGNDEATYDLFCLIHNASPNLAEQCADAAMPAIVKAFDFKLARSYMPDPEKKIECSAATFSHGIEWANRTTPLENQAAIIDVGVRDYANEVGMVVQVVSMSGETERAELLMEQAISLMESTALQDAVRAELSLLNTSKK
jgi:hypothetical protein